MHKLIYASDRLRLLPSLVTVLFISYVIVCLFIYILFICFLV